MPYWTVLAAGNGAVNDLHNIAMAYRDHYFDICGATPIARVQDLLGADISTAEKVLLGLEKVLHRKDLPTVTDILKTGERGKYHLVCPAALLAAERQFARMPECLLDWNNELAERLVAFYLVDGTGELELERIGTERVVGSMRACDCRFVSCNNAQTSASTPIVN